ncbi:hypothetical protein [Planomonospora venezuelensis]|uniref:Uncharacterized protein n=1 Tax=Planomonospora venezuelensis TaxID=1999 RepID=A0A841DF26_PLAVE|nr:hypothetical protein [Planomonospora venezuelensis]MBB5966685.1 hypothetical protein [Planomonospora venezuelensis]GIN00344.1 hypothetical protein Pve01_20020 [Planomonospora venezuelensis]
MFKRITAGALATAAGASLVLAAGAGTASATQAELGVNISEVSPNPVVVRGGRDVEVTIEVRATEAERVELRLRPDTDDPHTLVAKEPKLVRDGELWRYVTSFDKSDYRGRWVAIADAYGKDGKKATDTTGFTVKYVGGWKKADTRLADFDAGPEPVRKGRTLYFSGRLQARDHWKWRGVRGEEVEIYFRSGHSSAWKYVTSAETRWDGKFHAKTRAYRSGEFRAVFDGDRRLDDSSSRPDWVKVKRWHR